MYRYRLHTYPKTSEDYDRMVALGREWDELAGAKGWAQGTGWTMLTGDGNELVSDFDYPDLAAFQREGENQEKDPDFAQFLRKMDAVERTRPSRDELLATL